LPKPRHRAPRPPRRSLFNTLVVLVPLAIAVGVASLTSASPGSPTLAAATKPDPHHSPAPATSDSRRPAPTGDHKQNPSQHRTKREAPPTQAVNQNCTLTVPENPLTAQGLATPYQLAGTGNGGACHEANANQSAFVEATILDPATGALSVYRPLVIDRGTRAAVAPSAPTLPAGAVVGIWFGFNGDTITLRGNGDSLGQGQCVNGLGKSLFGEFAHCNAPGFFAAANAAIGAHRLVVPAVGAAKDGLPCPTTRDFSLVDQDQSDNVTTTYVATADGRTAQAGAAGAARLGNTTTLTNGSDNALLDAFVDPALGCRPFTAPDLTAGGAPATSLALNELQAAAGQAPPVALVPVGDPMTLVNGKPSVDKTNLYRAGVNQPPVNPATETTQAYCANLTSVGTNRLMTDRALFGKAPSPDAAAANLFDFLQQRLQGSIQKLACPAAH
jgi:hypothetical protein